MKRSQSDELADSIRGREDGDSLDPKELEMVAPAAEECAEFVAFLEELTNSVRGLHRMMAECRTVGHARAVLGRLDEVSAMLDRV